MKKMCQKRVKKKNSSKCWHRTGSGGYVKCEVQNICAIPYILTYLQSIKGKIMNWKQKLLSLRDKAEMLMYEDDINFEYLQI